MERAGRSFQMGFGKERLRMLRRYEQNDFPMETGWSFLLPYKPKYSGCFEISDYFT